MKRKYIDNDIDIENDGPKFLLQVLLFSLLITSINFCYHGIFWFPVINNIVSFCSIPD